MSRSNTTERQALMLPANAAVLGIDSRDNTLVWVRDTRKLWEIPRFRDLDEATLIQMLGRENVMPDAVDEYRAIIAEESRMRVFGHDDVLGQGVWGIPGFDGVIAVVGDRALAVSEMGASISVTSIDEPVFGGKLIDTTTAPGDGFCPEEFDAELSKVVLGRSADLFNELCKSLKSWKFLNNSAKDIAGYLIAAAIGGALPFRPHGWVHGPTNCGKTALLSLFKKLFPFTIQLDGESSEAALRQEIRNDAVLTVMDEAEPWHGRPRVLKVLRTGSRGGWVVKGTPSGEPMRYSLRCCVILASIDIDLRRDADRNRILLIELGIPEKIEMLDQRTARSLGLRLLAAAVAHAPRIIKTWSELMEDSDVRAFGRLAEVHAVPVAARAALCGVDAAAVKEALIATLSQQQARLQDRFDSEVDALLCDLLTSQLSATVSDGTGNPGPLVNGRQTVGDLLRKGEAKKLLEDNGIKVSDDRRWVYFACRVVQRHLLSRTRWVETDISEILMQCEGAKRDRQRVPAGNFRGVKVPWDSLDLDAAKGGVDESEET